MKVAAIIMLLVLISACGKSSSKTTSNVPHLEPRKDAVMSILGIAHYGLSFKEVGHRTSENQFAIVCTDVENQTNQSRLNALEELKKNLIKNDEKYPTDRYKIDSYTISGLEMKKLISEAINTLNYHSHILPSKYCPNSNLTPDGVIGPVE